jgi:hypothetical protein
MGAGMVAAGMGNSRGRLAVLVVSALGLAGAGCGGERQDANAPSGEFDVEVTDASFPTRQRIAEPTTLKLDVANRGDRAVPNLAVIVETEPRQEGQSPVAFAQRRDDPTLADNARPVWIVDEGPAGGDTAYDNTWAVGPLGEGQTRTVEWKLTAIEPGRYTVAWRLAPSLEGDVELAGGRTQGKFVVTIADAPVPSRVDDEGNVVRGEQPRERR